MTRLYNLGDSLLSNAHRVQGPIGACPGAEAYGVFITVRARFVVLKLPPYLL